MGDAGRLNNDNLELKSINTIRMLALDAVEAANSGHPGTPMGFASAAYVLWTEFLRHNPEHPEWPNRDRFVLSAGHASMLLYSLLHLTGYGLSLSDLKNFRQWGSLTPGHPEHGHTIGVEATTGPLGQGVGMGIGMALGLRRLSAVFNRPGYDLFDSRVFIVAGDGCMMEGVAQEAASFAGHQKLSNVILLYDNNHITIDGSTSLAFSEDVPARYSSMGWAVKHVLDGNNLAEVRSALSWATEPSLQTEDERNRPKFVSIRTLIGFGSPAYENTAHAHGSAFGAEEVRKTKINLGWPTEPSFLVPDDVRQAFLEKTGKRAASYKTWVDLSVRYAKAFPAEAAELDRWRHSEKIDGPLKEVKPYLSDPKGMATRQAFGEILQGAFKSVPGLFGGSADLAPSNNTLIKGEPACSPETPAGANLHFGVREHGMSAIMNGLALTGYFRVYGGTFLVFSDYMRGGMRLSSLMKQPVLYVLTHDSIALGEDGPTHQPVEHLVGLRSIPRMTVVRPADANETLAALDWFWSGHDGPLSLVLTRQKLPVLGQISYAELSAGVRKGGYVLRETSLPVKIVLIGSGSEVSLLLSVSDDLLAHGVGSRVVSMPSTTLFDHQPLEYRRSVLGTGIPRVFVEALSPLSWAPYASESDLLIGMTDFGASAPGEVLMKEFGFTREAIINRIKEQFKELF
ncbi:MAG: transketolase [Nitrospiraceae bacterium]|jgi:transketolase|nr:transketolase [Nitrospiraceae bacterium]